MLERLSCSSSLPIADPQRHHTRVFLLPGSDLRLWDGHGSARPETSSHHHSPCLGQTTRIPNGRSHPSESRSTRRRVVYQGIVASAKSPPISELGATTTWYRTRD